MDVKDLKVPATSVSNMLGARVPGIISVTRSGEPGKDFSDFWIRGISTFGAGSNALVLIDGVEGDMNTLDPEDMKADPEGFRYSCIRCEGANGVILITTKRRAGTFVNLKANSGCPILPYAWYLDGNQYAAWQTKLPCQELWNQL